MINFIINYFSSFIYKKNKTSTDNMLVFGIGNSGDPYIKIIISDTSEMASMRFAHLINNINLGMFENSILDILVKENDLTQDYKIFKENTILFWSTAINNYYKENDQESVDQPFISPLLFSKSFNQK